MSICAAPLNRRTFLTCLLALLVSLAAGHRDAHAQGTLIDTTPDAGFRMPRPFPRPTPLPTTQPPPSSYKIESLAVDAKISGSIARVQVSQTFVNTGSRQLAASFVFPLPYDGVIDQLTLLVDGKEFAGKLLPRDEARQRYEEIVRSNKDPALLEWVGTGMYQSSVFPIPPGAKRTVTLSYTQVCRTSHGLTDFLFPLRTAKYTAKPLEKLRLRIVVDSPTAIGNLYSGTHELKIERPAPGQAIVLVEQTHVVPDDDFRLFYDVPQDASNQAAAASVLSYFPASDDVPGKPSGTQQGYFLLLASPPVTADDQPPQPKTVVFVVDRSGSMSGEKIEQARGALKFVLNNLRDGDLFNIVAYDAKIESFKPELQRFDEQSRLAAMGFVEGLYAGGSTNIDAALTRTLGMLKDADRPSYVIFLTDGLPTVGEQSEAKIAANAAAANKVRARLFSFGVGYDVNSRLLDKLSAGNHGQSEYVRPKEDIEASVSKLYQRIGTPVMTGVRLTMKSDAAASDETNGKSNINISRVYPEGEFDLFAGDQRVIVGRYRTGGATRVTLAGKVRGEAHSFDYPAELVSESSDDSNAFIAKLWATRRVGELIDQIDLHGKNDELVKELVELATRHGILTPYTSFLADEGSEGLSRERIIGLADDSLGELEAISGQTATEQRAAKAMYKSTDFARNSAGQGQLGGENLAKLSAAGGRGVWFSDGKSDKRRLATTMFTLGRKTFVRREQLWIDTTVTEEDEKTVVKVERFSPEYFKLIEKHGQRVSRYLAMEEQVIVKIDGVTYTW